MRRASLFVLCFSLATLFPACSREALHTLTPRALTIAVVAGVEGDALKAASIEYRRLHPGLEIEIVELPYSSLFEKILLDVTFGTGAYDIVMMDDPWFPRLAEHDKLTAIEPLLDSISPPGLDPDFIPACIAVCREPYRTGKLYALPYVGNSQLYFYRKDLFEKYGLSPPKTWQEVRDAAKTIQEGEKIFGYVMRAAQGNAVVADYMPVFWAFGGEMFTADGRANLNSPASIAALRFMLEMGKYSPPAYVSFNADEVSAHLLQASAAQSINWPAWIPAMDDPAKSKVVGKIAFTTLPSGAQSGAAEIGNWLLAIPRQSRHSAEAFQFIAWATAPAQMRVAAARGNPPTRRSIFADPELRARFRAYPVQQQSLETSRPRPRTPYWNEIENSFGIYLSKANSGRMTPEDAMARANEEIQAILERTRQ